MFFIIGRVFGKLKEKKTAKEEVVEKKPEAGAPAPYSMNFEGASKIEVSLIDCRRENVESVGYSIVRSTKIKQVVNLLKELPIEGNKNKEIYPCKEHTLTAFKGNIKFAEVVFYEGELKLENELFISNNNKALAKQAELFNLIEVKLK